MLCRCRRDYGLQSAQLRLYHAQNAIALGALGFEVFPIHYMKERPFSGGVWECSCLDLERWFAKKENDPDREIKCHNKPAKHPAIKWKEAATSDADEIKDLWSIRRFQGANIAIATGERSGVYVIDLDGQVGMDSIRALEAIHGELPKTMMAFSGRGDGLHLFFKAPADAAGLTISAGTIGAGIDTRGNGGYVVGRAPTTPPCAAICGCRVMVLVRLRLPSCLSGSSKP